MMMGPLVTRIMAGLEEDDVDDDGESNWERVEVDIPGYRNMGDPSFKRHFRLSKATYEVWSVARMPGVVHFHYAYIIECLREVAPLHIKWPDKAKRERIKARFEVYSGFPGIVGCIDGTHNVVTAPPTQKERYRNRHHTYSYNTMAVCDDNLLIRNLYVGEVGSLHDSRVLKRSPLYLKLLTDENDEYLRPDEHIIGNKAYALMDCLMVPFKNYRSLTEQQRVYNYALSKCRMRIEHSFGKAFGQWRRMKILHSANLELAVDHFTACFVLQNVMILNGEKLLDLENPTILLEADGDGELENDEDELEERDEDEAAGRGVEHFNQLVVAAKLRGREKRIQIVNDL